MLQFLLSESEIPTSLVCSFVHPPLTPRGPVSSWRGMKEGEELSFAAERPSSSRNSPRRRRRGRGGAPEGGEWSAHGKQGGEGQEEIREELHWLTTQVAGGAARRSAQRLRTISAAGLLFWQLKMSETLLGWRGSERWNAAQIRHSVQSEYLDYRLPVLAQ